MNLHAADGSSHPVIPVGIVKVFNMMTSGLQETARAHSGKPHFEKGLGMYSVIGKSAEHNRHNQTSHKLLATAEGNYLLEAHALAQAMRTSVASCPGIFGRDCRTKISAGNSGNNGNGRAAAGCSPG